MGFRAAPAYLLVIIIGAFLLASILLLPTSATALDAPTGDVVLVIDGNINVSNAKRDNEAVAEFDVEMLRALDATTFSTNTPWLDVAQFTGVRLNLLLEAVGASLKESVVRATASDEYWYDLKDIDADTYPVIVAYERDGEPMTLRELGPLWIMFPFDDYPELATQKNNASSVWQLIGLTVK